MAEEFPAFDPHNLKYSRITDHGGFKFPIISSEKTEFSKTSVLPSLNFIEDDPIWLPVKNWESLDLENEQPLNSSRFSRPQQNVRYNPFVISEESLVRLAINAMNGIGSSISSIDKLSAAFCSELTDRYIGISTLWSSCLSTQSLGKLLKSLGYSGRLVIILRKFSDYLTCSTNSQPSSCDNKVDDLCFTRTGLVSQAFGVALKKILQGYAAALDTLHSSVGCSHHSSAMDSSESGGFTGVFHSKLTLLKVYLHTQELRNQIIAAGSICDVIHDFLCSSDSSVEDLDRKCLLHFSNFPRGGELLTYLYTKFRYVDRPQYPLLKFFFIQSCEPFSNFIRSWIYEAEIADPCGEFVGIKVKNDEHSSDFDDIDCVDLPCFVHGATLPFMRAGKQLQIVRKLLQFCSYPSTINEDFNWIIPHWNMFSGTHLLFPFSLRLSMNEICQVEHEMGEFYKRLMHKLDDNSMKFNFTDGNIFHSDKYTFFCGEATSSVPEISESCESSICESYSTCSQDTYELEPRNGTDEHDHIPVSFEEAYFSSLMQLKMTENRVLSNKSKFIKTQSNKTSDDLERFMCSTDKIKCFGNPHEKSNQDKGKQDDHPWFFVHPQKNPFPFNNICDAAEMIESSTNLMSFFQNRVPDFSTNPQRKSDSISIKNYSEYNFFDFSSVEDVSTTCIDKLSSKIIQNHENYPSHSQFDSASDISFSSESENSALGDHNNSENSYCNMVTNEHARTCTPTEFDSLVPLFDIPIDFVISKCIWQEIILQYKYVSKLTMKIFDQVFQLKEHLLTVRRYLFLEVADWVDIFTLSLCQCKWQSLDLKLLTSMVQGMLEASLEKSSCKSDPNKGRLYVYFKGDITIPQQIGIHSFEFLSLGYRAGWPVSNILSTSAMEKYTDIFNFLLHLNIVTTSLNNAWASLSGVMDFHRILSNMSYRVHHFVSTLQRHVQSQFKILWVTFIRVLERKIHDVVDLELTHTAYLNRALRVCFLTDETRRIGGIVEVIVQCAFDFGNLLHGIKWNKNGGMNTGVCNNDLTRILKIWSEFNRRIRDLYVFCRRSPEYVNSDISCFWDQLDYNGYYVNSH